MTLTAKQVHCPFCNAAQAPKSEGSYTCEFCLQPFSLVDSQKEERRLSEQIDKWLQQKIGAVAGSATADASSRAFIFQQKILPELRRDVDRALEPITSFAQHPLLQTPVDPPGGMTNPLLDERGRLGEFKGLRVRLASAQVTGFAVTEGDRGLIQKMDQRLATVLFLSNVAHAASRRDPAGYVSARKNLEELVIELRQTAAAGKGDAASSQFLEGLASRYSALAELCRLCEELASDNALAAAPLLERLEVQVQALRSAAEAIGASEYDPTESMPLVLGVRQEASSGVLLGRWLRAYETIANRSSASFVSFVEGMQATLPPGTPELQSEVLELTVSAIQVMRGVLPSWTAEDFSWSDGWAETSRSKKWLWFFGTEEVLAKLEKFLLPVWVAEVVYSKSTGALLKSGVEGKAFATVDACAPDASRVCIFDDPESPGVGPLLAVETLAARGAIIAAPRSTPQIAKALIEAAVRGRPELLNPKVKMRGMAYLPAAVAHYESKKGLREAACCWNGLIPTVPGVRTQVQVSQSLKQQFG